MVGFDGSKAATSLIVKNLGVIVVMPVGGWGSPPGESSISSIVAVGAAIGRGSVPLKARLIVT